jgi:hypothetical protein
MKLKKGDIVIYINHNNEWHVPSMLKIGEKYIIDHISVYKNSIDIIVNGVKYPYNINRFISLDEFRRLKIEKIKNEIQKR